MTSQRQGQAPAHPAQAFEDIPDSVDPEAVVDILRQAHPDLVDEDILGLLRAVMENRAG